MRDPIFWQHIGALLLIAALGLALWRERSNIRDDRFVVGFMTVTLLSEGLVGLFLYVMAYWQVYGL